MAVKCGEWVIASESETRNPSIPTSRFIKETIGVKYKTCDCACRAELNNLPMKIKI